MSLFSSFITFSVLILSNENAQRSKLNHCTVIVSNVSFCFALLYLVELNVRLFVCLFVRLTY